MKVSDEAPKCTGVWEGMSELQARLSDALDKIDIMSVERDIQWGRTQERIALIESLSERLAEFEKQ